MPRHTLPGRQRHSPTTVKTSSGGGATIPSECALGAALGALGSAADYVQAQRVRRVCQRRVGELFREVDLVVSPAMGTGALRYSETGELEADELQVILDTAFTWYWNGVGILQ